MEIVKPINTSSIKRRTRIRVDKSPIVLSRIVAVCNSMFNRPKLEKLINSLPPKDQAAFIMHFFRPAPLPTVKDAIDRANADEVDRMYKFLEDIKLAK